jgi:hypothetical protein
MQIPPNSSFIFPTAAYQDSCSVAKMEMDGGGKGPPAFISSSRVLVSVRFDHRFPLHQKYTNTVVRLVERDGAGKQTSLTLCKVLLSRNSNLLY